MSLKIRFTVTVEGRTQQVRLAKPLSAYGDVEKMTFVNRMKEAIESWKFEPALDNHGNAIAVKVILPIHVVEKDARPTALASLRLDNPRSAL